MHLYYMCLSHYDYAWYSLKEKNWFDFSFFFCTIGSGFKSLKAYGSGFFGMRIKLPNKDTTESSQPSTKYLIF